eukprot:sb/3467688/
MSIHTPGLAKNAAAGYMDKYGYTLTVVRVQSCRHLHFKFQNFKFPVQMCRLVKLKLLGRVGTSHNSPGQPPEVQNHPKSQKLDFRFGENDRIRKERAKNLTRNLMVPVVFTKSKIQFLTFWVVLDLWWLPRLAGLEDSNILVYCRSGGRAFSAAMNLLRYGFSNINVFYQGGFPNIQAAIFEESENDKKAHPTKNYCYIEGSSELCPQALSLLELNGAEDIMAQYIISFAPYILSIEIKFQAILKFEPKSIGKDEIFLYPTQPRSSLYLIRNRRYERKHLALANRIS